MQWALLTAKVLFTYTIGKVFAGDHLGLVLLVSPSTKQQSLRLDIGEVTGIIFRTAMTLSKEVNRPPRDLSNMHRALTGTAATCPNSDGSGISFLPSPLQAGRLDPTCDQHDDYSTDGEG